MDINKLLSLDIGYPGISFGYHSWALAGYLSALDNFIELAKEQYKVRASHELSTRRNEFSPGEYDQKQLQIVELADDHIPRYARLSALVPIWGIFEVTVSDITDYASSRSKSRLRLKDIRANTFEDKVEMYYDGVLGVSLPWSAEEKAAIRHLHTIRNAVAHRNGQFSDASKDRRTEIERAVVSVRGVTFRGSELVVESAYLQEAAELVFRMLGALNQVISDRWAYLE